MQENDYKKLFQLAMKNDIFKNIVNEHNLDENCLKNTTNYNSVFDFIESQSIDCTIGSFNDCKQSLKGQKLFIVYSSSLFYLNAKPCEHTLNKTINPETAFIYKNFDWKAFKDINESSFLPLLAEPLNYFKEFLDNKQKKGFFIHWSTFGGISKFMKYSAWNLSQQTTYKKANRNSIYYDSLPGLIATYREGFNNEKNDFSINKVKKAKILFLEDVGKEMSSVWTRDEVLYPILKYRVDNNLLTFIDSEFSLKELYEIYRGLIDVTRRVNHSVSDKRSKDIVEMIKALCKVFEI